MSSTPTWTDIYKAIESERSAREVYQGLVTDRDEVARVVWVRELSSDPIEVVGLGTDMVYFSGSARKVIKVPPAIPEIGDVVVLVRTISDQFKCIGILQSTRKWEPEPAIGLLPPDSVTSRELAPDSVTSAEIAADAVGNSELAANAVKNAEVDAAAAIARSKLDFGSGLVDADIAAAAAIEGSKLNWHVGSSPPASPVNGMLWLYTGVSGLYWLFVYDSGEATYKWKFVGGPPMEAVSDVQRTTSGPVWFADPVLTVPRAGVYAVKYYLEMHAAPNAGTMVAWIAYLGDGTSAWTAWKTNHHGQSGANNATWSASPSYGPRYATLAASMTLKLYGSPTNWDFISDVRGITIVPAKVS